jgi:homoaconitase/3-isopropylmalate dehydratase large subunit
MALTMTGQTLSEKIFSRAAKKQAHAGDFVMAGIDCAMIHDITGPLAVKGFYEIAGRDGRVWDPSKIVILFDQRTASRRQRTTSCSAVSQRSRESSTTTSSAEFATRYCPRRGTLCRGR